MTDHPAFRDIPAHEYLASSVGDDQLVDVREPDEVAAGSVAGAVNIPSGQLLGRLDELDPTRRVVLLCRSGNRSRRAAAQLAEQGFSDVVNLAGGIMSLDGDTDRDRNHPTDPTEPGGS